MSLNAFSVCMFHAVGTRANINAGTATSIRHFALLFSFNHWMKFPPISGRLSRILQILPGSFKLIFAGVTVLYLIEIYAIEWYTDVYCTWVVYYKEPRHGPCNNNVPISLI